MAGYLTHFGLKKAQTPFQDVMPEYTEDEFKEFKQRVKADGGVKMPIEVDPEGNILDGHTRQRAEPDCPFVILNHMTSEPEKRAYAFRVNFDRRHMNGTQRKQVRNKMKGTALALRADGWTLKGTALALGIGSSTVSDWEHAAGEVKSDRRRKVTLQQQREIAARTEAGETQQTIAEDIGVSQATVGRNMHISGSGNMHIKRSDPICKRALAVRASIKNKTESAEVASGRLGFAHPQEYRDAAAVADSGHSDLIEAVNDGLMNASTARKLLKSGVDIGDAIEKSKAKKIAQHNNEMGRSRTKSETLRDALEFTWTKWFGLANANMTRKSALPRSKKQRDELREMAERVRKTVNSFLDDLERSLDVH